MRTVAGSLAGWTAAMAAAAGIAGAQSGDRCTHDSFPVDGTAIAIAICVPADGHAPVPVTETLTRGSVSFDRTLTIEVVRGADVIHTVDEVPLDRFGSTKRLHLTIAYRDGTATIEHALLLPGALVLK